MNEKQAPKAPTWGRAESNAKRRDLTEDAAKKAGYPGALREQSGWHRGVRVTKRA